MAAVAEWWQDKPLTELTPQQWEALCDGCAKCCLHKLEDDDTGAISETNVACKLLDTGTARCMDYRHRKAFVPDCLRLTPRLVKDIAWLPRSCAYRRRAEGKPLPEWHYLLTGSRDAMVEAGACVAGRCISETQAGPLEHHLVDWGD